MYTSCYREMLCIYIILEIKFLSKCELHELRRAVSDVHRFESMEIYKTAFNNAVRERLIRTQRLGDKTMVYSERDNFIKFINNHKKENGTEFQDVCYHVFQLYKRKEVKDVTISDLLEIFQHKRSNRQSCGEISCRKYFIPNLSHKYCDECYEARTRRDCPKCVENKKDNINKIYGRMTMCSDCSKSEELQKVLDSNEPKVAIPCKICDKPFVPKHGKDHYCSSECKEIGHNYNRCSNPSCKRLRLRWSVTPDGLCSVCTEEKKPDTVVNRSNNTITRKCINPLCTSMVTVEFDDRSSVKIGRCQNCNDKKPQKEIRLCPSCNKVKLKKKQQICRVCKRQERQQRAKGIIANCAEPGCTNQFRKLGAMLYCPEHRKILKKPGIMATCENPNCGKGFRKLGRMKYCPECREERKTKKDRPLKSISTKLSNKSSSIPNNINVNVTFSIDQKIIDLVTNLLNKLTIKPN